jgi:hypothetical protein
MRIIYNDGSTISITDSVELAAPPSILQPHPPAIYPWQAAMLQHDINRTIGNVYFYAHRNSAEVATERLKKVVDENVFIKRLSFNEPGDYILTIKDGSGTMASGVLHVWDFKISYVGESYSRHVFNVTVDGMPLKGGEAVVSVNNGAEKKEIYISNGEMVVPAMLPKGDNAFNVEFEGTMINVPVKYENESVWDVYIKYGVPGFVIIVLVYLFARLSKRPTYTIRVSEGSKEIRREMKVNKGDVLEAVRKMREDTKLKRYPISFAEFEMALKRYVTEGADITEGNVDEILRRMVRDKELEQYDRYYQLPGEESIKERAILRMIREKLIENGVQFKEADNKFVTKDFEIGLYGAAYEKKAVIVVESNDDVERIIESLSETERAQMKIKQSNGLITFITFRKINEVF